MKYDNESKISGIITTTQEYLLLKRNQEGG